jgi:hypothetical protein
MLMKQRQHRRLYPSMPDPIMTAIATALASKTTETVFAGAKGALTALARLVRERFSHDENARRRWIQRRTRHMTAQR